MYHFEDPTIENAYREAISSASRPYNEVVGLITFTDDTTMEIDGSVLPTDAISISRQCVDSDELMFGGVFTDVLNLSLFVPANTDRYKFYDARIELTYRIEIGEDEFAEMPLGIFYVADADRNSDEIKLTAYDSITLLDKPLGDVQVTGTAWEMFQQVARDTDYELAFDETDLAQFINYNQYADGSSVNSMQTYRDIVKELCQMLGCFALDNREGKLALKAFSSTTDLELNTGDWYSAIPADYECSYIGVTLKSMAGVFTKISEDPTEVGNIMSIEDAPAWDYGTETQPIKTNNLYNLLRTIRYTPCSIDMPSDPSFECGDRLELTLRDGTVIETLITSVEWQFHNGMSVESVGKNPYFEATALSEEGGRILSQAVSKSKIQFINFTNGKRIEIEDTETAKIGECIFTPTNVTSGLFVATILVDVSEVADEIDTTSTESVNVPVIAYDQQEQPLTLVDINGNPVDHLFGTALNTHTYAKDGKCEISIFYKLDGTLLPSDEDPYIAITELPNGKHIITVSYTLNVTEPYHRYYFDIFMSVSGGTVVLPIYTLQASLVGQELDEITRFDGTIRVEQEPITLNDFGYMGVAEMTHGEFTITEINDPNVTPYVHMDNQLALIKALQIPDPDDPELPVILDTISLYNINSISVRTIEEGTNEFIPQMYFYSYTLSTEDDEDVLCTETDTTIIFETEGMPSSTPQSEE